MEAGSTIRMASAPVELTANRPSAGSRVPNVTEVRRHRTDCPVTSVWFAGETAVFVGSDSSMMRVPIGGQEQLLAAHDDVILVSAGDGNRVATAGSDGRVLAIDPDGAITEVGNVGRKRWVSTIAIGPRGVAYGIGRDLFFCSNDGAQLQRHSEAPLTAIAFSPNGETLALASRDGVCLWTPETGQERQLRAGAGPATSLRFSPDGLFLVETYYEPLLAARCLDNDTILVMNGPTARVRSVDWSAFGPTLLASGARHMIVSPILSAGGQLSTLPRLFAPYREQVSVVAHHPLEPIAAVGYADGLILLVRLIDGAEIVLKSADGEAPAGLAWSLSGRGLAIGRADGQAILYVIDFN